MAGLGLQKFLLVSSLVATQIILKDLCYGSSSHETSCSLFGKNSGGQPQPFKSGSVLAGQLVLQNSWRNEGTQLFYPECRLLFRDYRNRHFMQAVV